MPARRFVPVSRAALAAAVLGAFAQGCSGAPPGPARTESALCAPEALDACERRLAASSIEGPSRALVAAYAAARAARDASDPWAKLYRDLDAADRGPRPKEADSAAEAALHAAFEAAAALRYVDAARASAQLSALLEKREVPTEPVLRWRYALQLLAAAGLVLDAEETAAPAVAAATSAPPPAPAREPAPPGPDDTPYASYLRVVSAKDSRKEWEVRGAQVLAGLAAERRDDFASMFSRSHDCDARRPPPMDSARDLVFANKLSGALPRDLAAPLGAGQLPLREWLGAVPAGLDTGERSTVSYPQGRGQARAVGAYLSGIDDGCEGESQNMRMSIVELHLLGTLNRSFDTGTQACRSTSR